LTNTNSETLAILVPAAQHRHRSRLGSCLFFILNNSFNIRHTLQLQLHLHSLYYDLKYVSIVYVTSHERIYVTVIRYSITNSETETCVYVTSHPHQIIYVTVIHIPSHTTTTTISTFATHQNFNIRNNNNSFNIRHTLHIHFHFIIIIWSMRLCHIAWKNIRHSH